MQVMQQRSPAPIESMQQRPSPYREFLEVANEAHRCANDEQRRLMRQLASTHPTPQDATAGIRQIMGW